MKRKRKLKKSQKRQLILTLVSASATLIVLVIATIAWFVNMKQVSGDGVKINAFETRPEMEYRFVRGEDINGNWKTFDWKDPTYTGTGEAPEIEWKKFSSLHTGFNIAPNLKAPGDILFVQIKIKNDGTTPVSVREFGFLEAEEDEEVPVRIIPEGGTEEDAEAYYLGTQIRTKLLEVDGTAVSDAEDENSGYKYLTEIDENNTVSSPRVTLFSSDNNVIAAHGEQIFTFLIEFENKSVSQNEFKHFGTTRPDGTKGNECCKRKLFVDYSTVLNDNDNN